MNTLKQKPLEFVFINKDDSVVYHSGWKDQRSKWINTYFCQMCFGKTTDRTSVCNACQRSRGIKYIFLYERVGITFQDLN